jgi:hypothetical protein
MYASAARTHLITARVISAELHEWAVQSCPSHMAPGWRLQP